MPFPTTVDELREQGYRFLGHRLCSSPKCKQQIEFWQTPRGKRIPLDIDPAGKVAPHWARCAGCEDFRK